MEVGLSVVVIQMTQHARGGFRDGKKAKYIYCNMRQWDHVAAEG